MDEIILILQTLLASGGIVTIAGLAWKILLQNMEIKTGNDKLDAIVAASQKTAVATDYYIRINADGKITVEEGAEFGNLAAEAIVSQLTAVEVITGKQIYNRPEVPLPLPVGGTRATTETPATTTEVNQNDVINSTTTTQTTEQSAQPVSLNAGA